MAEKLKTFVDTTWTLSDVDTSTNKLTMFTNDANTQAVVKDVQVNVSKKIKGTMNIGNCVVSDEITTLSGSAIVDKNEGMSIEIPVPFDITITRSAYDMYIANLHYATSTTNFTTVENGIRVVTLPQTTTIDGTILSESEIAYTYKSVLNIDKFPNAGALPTELKTLKNIATMSQPAFVYRHSNTRMYYFYYDSNSTTQLLYSTNEGASWVALETSSYAYKCINQNGRISWVSGTAYGFVNPGEMAVSGTVQLSGRAGINTTTSTYTHASECNGWHFCCPNNSYTTTLYGYHKDKNIAVNITLTGAMNVSSGGGLCVSYNATEGKYFIMSWNAAVRHLHIINTDIDALVADSTGTGTRLTTSLGIAHCTTYDTVTTWLPGTNDIIFRATGTNKPMRTTIYGTTPFFTTPTLVHDEAIIGGVCPSVTIAIGEEKVIDVYADYLDTTATIQVRATGVEITE